MAEQKQNIIFVGAHPDDFASGMGGTAALLSREFFLHVICATKGAVRSLGDKMQAHAETRAKEEIKSNKLIGADVTFLDCIDQEVFADRQTCDKLRVAFEQLAPLAVFTPWCADNHPDHSAICEAVRKALRNFKIKPELYFCEFSCSGQTRHFIPDIYVDITSVIETKRCMVQCHETQNEDDLMWQGTLTRARFRGFEHNIFTDYAEAFISYSGYDRNHGSLLKTRFV